MNPLVVVLMAQALYTGSDLMARHFMGTYGFTMSNFLSPWFLGYFTLRTIAMFGTLYAFTAFGLGKNVALFGATSIVLGSVFGYLLLGEVLTGTQYVGIMLAVTAFIVLALR